MTRRRMSPILKILALIFLFCIFSLPIQACTLWSATGQSVQGGGSLIVKNRDWAPDHSQELRLIVPKQGYRYLGLFAVGNDSPGIKAGINERGLVVISASASSIPKKERLAISHTPNLMTKLLTRCSTVHEVLQNRSWFVGAEFLMVADRTCIAYLELAPGGGLAIKVVSNGVLSHTNHYLEPDLVGFNHSIGTSSKTRLERINTLLASDKPIPFSLKQFITFSNDHNAGPDNSIWRTGSKPKSERTLAAWIVALPVDSDPILYLKLANPNQPVKTIQLNVKQAFNQYQSVNHTFGESEYQPN